MIMFAMAQVAAELKISCSSMCNGIDSDALMHFGSAPVVARSKESGLPAWTTAFSIEAEGFCVER